MSPRTATAPAGKGRGRNLEVMARSKQMSTIVPDTFPGSATAPECIEGRRVSGSSRIRATSLTEQAPEFIPGPSVFSSCAQIAALAGGGLS